MKVDQLHRHIRDTNTAIRKLAAQADMYKSHGQNDLASKLYHSAADMANDALCELPNLTRHYDAGLSITASVMYAKAGNHHGAYEHANRALGRELCPRWAVPILRKLWTSALKNRGHPHKHS